MPLLKKTENYKHIIWDWNGTILNDLKVAVKSVNVLLQEHQLEPICEQKYLAEFGFPVRKFYECIGFDLTETCFASLCDRFMQEYDRHRDDHARLHEGIVTVLKQISQSSRIQSILSAAEQWHLEEITKNFEVDHFFDHIFGIDNNQAGDKIYRGRELVERSGIDREHTILIGDTLHDHEVGEALGIDVLLVADGHQSFERLQHSECSVLPTRFA